mgnify:CR=1 FL=1
MVVVENHFPYRLSLYICTCTLINSLSLLKEYLLFLDTEASGLPRKWNVPYSDSANWPSAVQVSWLIYKKNGELVKTANYYICDADIIIDASAIKIHGITRDYLDANGLERTVVMQQLARDMEYYKPLVLGHFAEFDFHVLSADFHRAKIWNPLPALPSFCTMLASSLYVRDPKINHLRLSELYAILFKKKLEDSHNALADAKATAECFFELWRRGDVNDAKIEAQQLSRKTSKGSVGFPWLFSFLLFLSFAMLISLLV